MLLVSVSTRALLPLGRAAPVERGAQPGGARRPVEGGVRARDRQPPVVVAAADERVAPLQVEHRRERVRLRPARHVRGRDPVGDAAQALLVRAVARAVDQLQVAEHEERALEVAARQPAIHLRQRVTKEMRNILRVQIPDQLVDILAQSLDLAVLRLVDVEHDRMQNAAVLGEARRHLFADEGVGGERAQLEGAVDGVVVGDGDQRHSPSSGGLVDLLRGGVAFGRRSGPQEIAVRAIGGSGVHVKIDPILAAVGFVHDLLLA
jgi:hypothetical protein